MPFRKPYFASKKLAGKIAKLNELKKKQKEEGPQVPPAVNNYHANKKSTVGKSVNVPFIKVEVEGAPKQVNNLKVGAPNVAKSLNVYPVEDVPRRNVEENIPTVNAVSSKIKVHKPVAAEGAQTFFPVAKQIKKRRSRKKKDT